jgi:uncharacterized protein
MPGEFQIFVKPAGAACNLACTYCYYLGKKDLYPEACSKKMNEDILEKYIWQHIEASSENPILFSWHGGEPLLAGIGFYRKAIGIQKKYLPAGRMAINGIQTNGTLLNDEWCSFLKSENFIAGISMDGPGILHNRHRLTQAGEPTSKDVRRGYDLLRKYGITTEILCVVSAYNSDHPLEVYNFFMQLEAGFITFLPLVERSVADDSGVSSRSVKAEKFGKFLATLFDEWKENDIGKIKIQIFEEALRAAFNQDHTLCIFKANCGGVPVIEHNGDFYSCDHFVDRANLLGNITDSTITSFLDSPEQIKFGLAKSETLPGYCKICEVRAMCNGECPKNRFLKTPDGEPGLNYLCSGYKMFFTHCLPFIETIRAVRTDN